MLRIKQVFKPVSFGLVFFWSILFLKLVSSYYFKSYYSENLFIPFINWFTLNNFHNPWDFFYKINLNNMFPYPTIMLWIMSIPRVILGFLLSSDWKEVSNLHLLILRIPLLIADLGIYLTLKRLIPNNNKLLYLYWASPIVFFINYIHGQLDIVPTALFLAALYVLLNRKLVLAMFILGLASASKTHILIALPFLLIYIIKQKYELQIILKSVMVFILTYVIFLLPYLLSESFINMVFHAPEQTSFYEFLIPVSAQLSIVVCPTAIFLLFLRFSSYRKLNREILIMFLGILFALLVIFVTPQPGRFIWSLPFMIYFYLHNRSQSKSPFIFYNIVYFIYFMFIYNNPASIFYHLMDKSLVDNLALSLIISSLTYNTYWMYQIGVMRNEEIKLKENPLLIGIGGDSSTGKHSLFRVLSELLTPTQCIALYGDDRHKWERGDENWKVNTHLNPKANRLHDEIETAISLKNGHFVQRAHYNHKTGRFDKERTLSSGKFIFFVGLHPFYLKRMRELIDIKIYLDPDEKLRKQWKISRDTLKRGYSKQKVLAQIESRLTDAKKYILPQKEFADLVIRYQSFTKIGSRSKFKVIYELDNSIDISAVADLLEKQPEIKSDLIPGDDLKRQTLEVGGSIESKSIEMIADELKIQLDDLQVNKPLWHSNLDGITQLLFILIYQDKMKNMKPLLGNL